MEVFRWHLKSAINGNSEARNNLSGFHYYGIGSSKNNIKAFQWYFKSENQEYALSQYNLQECIPGQ